MIILTAKFKVKGIIKNTQAKFFKDLKVGDEFELVYDLNGGYGDSSVVYILQKKIKGEGFEVVHWNYPGQLKRNLENFTLKKIFSFSESKEYEKISA